MCSRFLRIAAAVVLAIVAGAAAARELRVCADPDNLPFSHRDGGGFENRIAELLARDLGAVLAYHWHPQWRGFVRRTLDAGACDLVVGMPAGSERVRTTRPYYRSRYAFVSPADAPPFVSLDDPRLASGPIGVQLPGNDMAETPAGRALARRSIVRNVRGYTPLGPRPAAQRIVDDVESGALDAAIVWGPQAGYFGRRHQRPMLVTPVIGHADDEPLEFPIAMAVRRDDAALAREIDAAIGRLQPAIDAILRDYGVPRSDTADPSLQASR